jgi:hypothetical protein
LLIVAWSLTALACFCPFASRAANDSLSLTITPPFFELNVNPGDSWASSIRVVNANAGELTVYGSVMGFAASDEEGHGTFIALADLANDSDALANWITVLKDPIVIPPDGAVDVPFSVAVPKDASPGGHYAAILIGTEPSLNGMAGSRIGVGSFISSLIFVRVGGDIKEEGSITEFSTSQGTYANPDVPFTLKFQNTGNVHLHPMGEVEIYNAWGKECGKIEINQTNLGYVLPSSTRRFDFEWRGETSWFDIGPYTAVATLAYGEDGNKSVSQTISFWILPVWRMVIVALGTLLFLLVFVVAIRRYVRRALALEMAKYGPATAGRRETEPPVSSQILREPAIRGVVDLRRAYPDAKDGGVGFSWRKYLGFLRKYAFFVILFALVLLGILWISLYYVR